MTNEKTKLLTVILAMAVLATAACPCNSETLPENGERTAVSPRSFASQPVNGEQMPPPPPPPREKDVKGNVRTACSRWEKWPWGTDWPLTESTPNSPTPTTSLRAKRSNLPQGERGSGGEDKPLSVIRYPLTVKTNLLYDVALTPNIGVEVPIGERFSVGAEFMRGWWLKRDWSFCWQVEAVSLEGRYWFTPLMERHLRGGWFVGAFAQAGFYDFQLNSSSGLQGEALAAGVTGGYLCPLGGAWSLEFSLGIGYLLTDYHRYTVEPTRDGHELVSAAPPMRLHGVLYPIKAGISLQWTIKTRRAR
jgi:hypothetical protein